MLHTPCLPRLQVIVIASPHCRLMGICFVIDCHYRYMQHGRLEKVRPSRPSVMSGYCRRNFTPPPVLGRFIGVCFFINYYKRGVMLVLRVEVEHVGDTLLSKRGRDCAARPPQRD